MLVQHFVSKRVIAEGSSATAMPLCGSKLIQLLGRLAMKKLLNPKSPDICSIFSPEKKQLVFFALKNLGEIFSDFFRGGDGPKLLHSEVIIYCSSSN